MAINACFCAVIVVRTQLVEGNCKE